jgi:hypothetical protein
MPAMISDALYCGAGLVFLLACWQVRQGKRLKTRQASVAGTSGT